MRRVRWAWKRAGQKSSGEFANNENEKLAGLLEPTRALYLIFQAGTKKDKGAPPTKTKSESGTSKDQKAGDVARHPFASKPPFNVWEILNISSRSGIFSTTVAAGVFQIFITGINTVLREICAMFRQGKFCGGACLYCTIIPVGQRLRVNELKCFTNCQGWVYSVLSPV